MYVNGQNQDVLCRSNQIINDTSLFKLGQIRDNVYQESCYYYQFLNQTFELYLDAKCNINAPVTPSDLFFCICSN